MPLHYHRDTGRSFQGSRLRKAWTVKRDNASRKRPHLQDRMLPTTRSAAVMRDTVLTRPYVGFWIWLDTIEITVYARQCITDSGDHTAWYHLLWWIQISPETIREGAIVASPWWTVQQLLRLGGGNVMVWWRAFPINIEQMCICVEVDSGVIKICRRCITIMLECIQHVSPWTSLTGTACQL